MSDLYIYIFVMRSKSPSKFIPQSPAEDKLKIIIRIRPTLVEEDTR